MGDFADMAMAEEHEAKHREEQLSGMYESGFDDGRESIIKDKDLISRQDVIEMLEIATKNVKGRSGWHEGARGGIDIATKLINQLPSAEASP